MSPDRSDGDAVAITLVVAAGENNVIGVDGGLPWRLPDDLRHFKAATIGRPVVMGRRTFEDLGRRPLPGRLNIVVSGTMGPGEGYEVAGSLVEALERGSEAARSAHQRDREAPLEVCVIGGGQIYRQALEHATRIVLTRVHASPEGDTTFPDVPRPTWRLERQERHEVDARHAHAFTFEWWARV